MIGWGDVYEVVEAMAPLYVALGLGYASVRWWHFFTPEQCAAIHSLVVYFVIPFFNFGFTAHIDPYSANYRVLAADAASKILTALIMAGWCRWCGSSSGWAITVFSLAQLTNTLVVGAPLFEAMYGQWAQDVIVQISVAQGIVWVPLLLFALEMMRARKDRGGDGRAAGGGRMVIMRARKDGGGDGRAASVGRMAVADEASEAAEKDLEGNEPVTSDDTLATSYVELMKTVTLKLAVNPNVYASLFGVIWALLSKRWHFELPKIADNSVMVMGKAGTGLSMYSLGLFMAMQEKLLACGVKHTMLGLLVKFIAGPAITAVAAFAVGLHGNFLIVAIMQNALPQSIMSFVLAREYGLHADVISCSVIFGTIISLPVLVAYYIILGFLTY